ncbi:MAG TPA: manganese efflux pump MntP family protein [Kofleriaceae bacterium]|jgi:putative Mn2+ efflux pump MntP
MLEALALGLALAMDAMAVAALRGLQNRDRQAGFRDVLMLPLLFGGFQSAMTALGWILGKSGSTHIAAYFPWIAVVLLVILGGKMAYSGFFKKEVDEEETGKRGLVIDLGLALATSIDAAAAGITLPLVPVAPWVAIAIIGVVTWTICMFGYALGKAAGTRIGPRLEGIGGLLLIAIGVRVLVQQL